MNPTCIRVKQATISVLEKGFVKILIDEEAEITSRDILDINAAKNELVGNDPYIVLFVAPKQGTITSEARAASATNEVYHNAIAKAIVTKSIAQRLVGSFFIKFNKPPAPTKLFSIEKDAIEWLKLMRKGSAAPVNLKGEV